MSTRTNAEPRARAATPDTLPPPARTPPRPERSPTAPPWSHRLLPRTVRAAMAALGWWTNPVPQRPSRHLLQVAAVLGRYGWCQSLDVSPTGRMCIRGAQALLEKTGHVTPACRARAVTYMEETLRAGGISMGFFAWNDLPGNEFEAVDRLLQLAATRAAQKGD